MNLIIGSAQIGMRYGLNKKKIPKKHINKVYQLCKNNNIEYIDTANSYGVSEKVIGKSKLNNLKIITKIIIPGNISNKNLRIFIQSHLKKTIKKLNVKRVYAILLHDLSIFKRSNKAIILDAFDELKKKKLIKYFGASVYSPNDVNKLLRFWKPDIIQFPLNILDQRFLKDNFIKKLKKKQIIFLSRSSFLQGFLLQNVKNYPMIKLQKFKFILQKIDKWCEDNKISRIDACIHFVKNISHIDYMIVGFDDYYQLGKIIKSFKLKNIKIPQTFKVNNLQLIDPRKWK